MKTIKLIILAAFLLPALVSQAQTKEETIAWLKEKLGSYLTHSYTEDLVFRNIKLISINECEVVITYECRGKGESDYVLCRETFPTLGWKIDKTGKIRFNSNVVTSTLSSTSEVFHFPFVGHVQIANREENIYERIQKAIDHLATFCPKKKEAF